MPIGVGNSNQAAFTLLAPIPAGSWHLVGDGEDISGSVTVRFDLIWRSGASNMTIGSATHTFSSSATTYTADLNASAVGPLAAGDQLILKFSPTGGDSGASYTPNGDGAAAGGSVPNLTLPQ